MNKAELEAKLVVGAKIKIGSECAEARPFTFKAGDVITLIEGHFEYENGLYTEDRYCPAVWDEEAEDYDSIYHLFGNDLEHFEDCKIV